jgi:dihydroxyacetone kinase DhaKLM complex PTS-EIIA-like component DhaM
MNNFAELRKGLDLVLNNHHKSVDHNKVVKYVNDLHSYIDIQEKYYNDIPDNIKTTNTLNIIAHDVQKRIDNLRQLGEPSKEVAGAYFNRLQEQNTDLENDVVITMAFLRECDSKEKQSKLESANEIKVLTNENLKLAGQVTNLTNELKDEKQSNVLNINDLNKCSTDLVYNIKIVKELTNKNSELVDVLQEVKESLQTEKVLCIEKITKMDANAKVVVNKYEEKLINTETKCKEVKDRLEENLNKSRTTIREYEENSKTLTNELLTSNTNNTDLNTKNEQYKLELANLQKSFDNSTKECSAKNTELEGQLKDIIYKFELEKQDHQFTIGTLADVRAELEALNEKNKSLQDELTKSITDAKEHIQSSDILKESTTKFLQEIEELKAKLTTGNAENVKILSDLGSSNENLRLANELHDKTKHLFEESKNEYNKLKEEKDVTVKDMQNQLNILNEKNQTLQVELNKSIETMNKNLQTNSNADLSSSDELNQLKEANKKTLLKHLNDINKLKVELDASNTKNVEILSDLGSAKEALRIANESHDKAIKEFEASKIVYQKQINDINEQAKQQIIDLNNSHKDELMAHSTKIKSLDGQIKSLEGNSNLSIGKLNETIASLNNEIDDLISKHNKLSDQLQESYDELDKYEKVINELKQTHKVKVDELNMQITKLEKQVYDALPPLPEKQTESKKQVYDALPPLPEKQTESKPNSRSTTANTAEGDINGPKRDYLRKSNTTLAETSFINLKNKFYKIRNDYDNKKSIISYSNMKELMTIQNLYNDLYMNLYESNDYPILEDFTKFSTEFDDFGLIIRDTTLNNIKRENVAMDKQQLPFSNVDRKWLRDTFKKNRVAWETIYGLDASFLDKINTLDAKIQLAGQVFGAGPTRSIKPMDQCCVM